MLQYLPSGSSISSAVSPAFTDVVHPTLVWASGNLPQAALSGAALNAAVLPGGNGSISEGTRSARITADADSATDADTYSQSASATDNLDVVAFKSQVKLGDVVIVRPYEALPGVPTADVQGRVLDYMTDEVYQPDGESCQGVGLPCCFMGCCWACTAKPEYSSGVFAPVS